MPELPEVETVVRTLRPKLVGKTITGVKLCRRDILTPPDVDLAVLLLGRQIESIQRRGKRIIFAIETGQRFYIHLGMTGRLTVEVPAAPMPIHTHLLINFGSDQLRFRDPRRFGGVWWAGSDDDCSGSMGPEPLEIRPAELAERLARTSRAVKVALLDQQLIAGLGNIYVDESLFAAGIHPQQAANTLNAEQVGRLARAIKMILRRALRHRGSTLRDYVDADGAAGGFQRLHRVYDRASKPCSNCKSPIERIVLGGRSTHFCAHCQPLKRLRKKR